MFLPFSPTFLSKIATKRYNKNFKFKIKPIPETVLLSDSVKCVLKEKEGKL